MNIFFNLQTTIDETISEINIASNVVQSTPLASNIPKNEPKSEPKSRRGRVIKKTKYLYDFEETATTPAKRKRPSESVQLPATKVKKVSNFGILDGSGFVPFKQLQYCVRPYG